MTNWSKIGSELFEEMKRENLLQDLRAEGSLQVLSEDGRDIKLSVDKLLHHKLSKILLRLVQVPVLSEEDELIEADLLDSYWILDPLDGTYNFARGIPLSCISVAMIDKGVPVFGLIYDFNRSDLYMGGRGFPAILNDRTIKTSCINEMGKAILCTGIPLLNRLDDNATLSFIGSFRKFKKVRMLGSAALSLSWVASGKIDAYMEESIRIWDVAAGLAILEAAGGTYSMKLSDNPTILDVFASNGRISWF